MHCGTCVEGILLFSFNPNDFSSQQVGTKTSYCFNLDSESPPHLHAWGPEVVRKKTGGLKRSVSSPVRPRAIVRKRDTSIRMSTTDRPNKHQLLRDDLTADNSLSDTTDDDDVAKPSLLRLPSLESATMLNGLKMEGKRDVWTMIRLKS